MSSKVSIVLDGTKIMPASKFEELELDADEFTVYDNDFFAFQGTVYLHCSIEIALQEWFQNGLSEDADEIIPILENRESVPIWDGANFTVTLDIPESLSEGVVDVLNKIGALKQ
jgi:ACT domain-containing protein